MTDQFDPRLIAMLLFLVRPDNDTSLFDKIFPDWWVGAVLGERKYSRRRIDEYLRYRMEYLMRHTPAPLRTKMGMSVEHVVVKHLAALERLGWIQPHSSADYDGHAPWNRWRLSTPEELGDRLPFDGPDSRPDSANAGSSDGNSAGHDNGGEGNVGGNGRNGMDGGSGRGGVPSGSDGTPGDGGGGVRGVLSHPTLFSLPSDEFERYVDNLFDGSGTP